MPISKNIIDIIVSYNNGEYTENEWVQFMKKTIEMDFIIMVLNHYYKNDNNSTIYICFDCRIEVVLSPFNGIRFETLDKSNCFDIKLLFDVISKYLDQKSNAEVKIIKALMINGVINFIYIYEHSIEHIFESKLCKSIQQFINAVGLLCKK